MAIARRLDFGEMNGSETGFDSDGEVMDDSEDEFDFDGELDGSEDEFDSDDEEMETGMLTPRNNNAQIGPNGLVGAPSPEPLETGLPSTPQRGYLNTIRRVLVLNSPVTDAPGEPEFH